jgi:1,4-dihydroxy-2-naphthoate octaprenyltransferase
MMPGMGYFVSFGGIDPWFILLSLPIMCFTFFFIITVEMPDVEADLLAKKRNLLTDHGRRFGVLASLLFTTAGMLSLLALAALDALGNKALFLWLSVFAIFPFLGAASGLFNRLSTPKEIYRQTKINFASLIIFMLCADAYLLLPWI